MKEMPSAAPNITVVGIDFRCASVDVLEQFALSKREIAIMTHALIENNCAESCLILSTCNRIEFWFTACSGDAEPLLCNGYSRLNRTIPAHGSKFYRFEGSEAFRYACELAAGIHSQVFGEDQILGQMKSALEDARANGTLDSVMETLFRMAITSAKSIKTQVRLNQKDPSVPRRSIETMEEILGELTDKRCLVIGNGEMGQLTAQLLTEQGAKVWMTVRKLSHRKVSLPDGVQGIPYEERYALLSEMDVICSATTSPHHTLSQCDMPSLEQRAYLFFDLAIPRDIDPTIAELPNVQLCNMDDLDGIEPCDPVVWETAQRIIQRQQRQFNNWYCNRDAVRMIQEIGRRTAHLTNHKLLPVYKTNGLAEERRSDASSSVERAVTKSVEKLLFSAKEHMEEEVWLTCLTGLFHGLEEMK